MILAALLASAWLAAAQPAEAPSIPATSVLVAPKPAQVLPGAPLEFRSVDGWVLHAVWQQAQEGKPTLVLLSGTGQHKEVWRPFARALAKAGIGYAALDMRGHGESRTTPTGEVITYKKLRAVAKGANDYADMVRDVEALVANLTTASGVPEETIALAGAEVGGSVAVKYAAVHNKVPFVIMFSPGLAWQEIPLVNAVRVFKGRATSLLMVHSEADKRSSKETPLLYAFAKNAVGERNATLIVVPEERGTRMLTRNKGLIARVLAWISDPHTVETPAVSTATVVESLDPAEPEIDPAPTEDDAQ